MVRDTSGGKKVGKEVVLCQRSKTKVIEEIPEETEDNFFEGQEK
jgi:hypothetical protein